LSRQITVIGELSFQIQKPQWATSMLGSCCWYPYACHISWAQNCWLCHNAAGSMLYLCARCVGMGRNTCSSAHLRHKRSMPEGDTTVLLSDNMVKDPEPEVIWGTPSKGFWHVLSARSMHQGTSKCVVRPQLFTSPGR